MLFPTNLPNAGAGISAQQLENYWQHQNFQIMSHFLVTYQGTQDRLNDHTQAPMLSGLQLASHPTQQLAASRDEHDRFSKMVERAFGEKIALNRYEQNLQMLVGETGLPDEVPPILEQGDGFRAFVNVLSRSMVRPAPVIIIDEPEAFLHPPQARLLGRYLASRTPEDCQVFIATHSSDFLAGVLGAERKPVALVRLANSTGTRTARVLEPDAVAELLDTPLLRYSNIISGLFHDGVILCEAESDCQFYAATLDVAHTADDLDSNLVFLHVNGKSRLADTADKLRKCGLPVAVVADLDLIRDPGQFRPAVELLGGTWSDVEGAVSSVSQHVNSLVITQSAQSVLEGVKNILGSPKATEVLTTDQAQKIAELAKAGNGWVTLKRGGVSALSGTNAYSAVISLIEYAAKIGLFLVPVGELEGWVPQVPSGNKKTWFNTVFNEGYWRQPTTELRSFALDVEAYTRRG